MQYPDLRPFLTVISNHGEAITGAVSALTIAAIIQMPNKAPLLRAEHPLQEVWTWMRDTLQTAIPAARHSASAKQNP